MNRALARFEYVKNYKYVASDKKHDACNFWLCNECSTAHIVKTDTFISPFAVEFMSNSKSYKLLSKLPHIVGTHNHINFAHPRKCDCCNKLTSYLWHFKEVV